MVWKQFFVISGGICTEGILTCIVFILIFDCEVLCDSLSVKGAIYKYILLTYINGWDQITESVKWTWKINKLNSDFSGSVNFINWYIEMLSVINE